MCVQTRAGKQRRLGQHATKQLKQGGRRGENRRRNANSGPNTSSRSVVVLCFRSLFSFFVCLSRVPVLSFDPGSQFAAAISHHSIDPPPPSSPLASSQMTTTPRSNGGEEKGQIGSRTRHAHRQGVCHPVPSPSPSHCFPPPLTPLPPAAPLS